MTFLEKIIQHKKQEVAKRRTQVPISKLETSPFFHLPPTSLKEHLLHTEEGGVIAEFKRSSPSQGVINEGRTVREVTNGYIKAGAIGLSVLTDQTFFGGSLADLSEARRYNMNPILRKDFIVDEYQIYEAKSVGADVILLIAECLEPEQVQYLARRAGELGLEVLLEMHSADQLQKLVPEVQIVGVNNRDLHSFKVDLATSFQLIEAIPKSYCCISESGISTPDEAVQLRNAGYRGFLMGTHFMKSPDPSKACASFIQEVRKRQYAIKNQRA